MTLPVVATSTARAGTSLGISLIVLLLLRD